MDDLKELFVEYISAVAGQPVAWEEPEGGRLPSYLAQRYHPAPLSIGQRRFLGILLKDTSDFSPSRFTKHLQKLLTGAPDVEGYCLIARDLPGYIRQRLVERQMPFVVPGRQMYWPELGLAIQSRKRKHLPLAGENLSPATQVVLIGALVGDLPNGATPNLLAEKLGYTPMTMSRALDEIKANGLGKVERKGRERQLAFPGDRRETWEKALPHLRSPVRDTFRVRENDLPPNFRIKAGETALAELSMLIPPQESVYALGRKTWKGMADAVEKIPVEEEDTCRLQVWRYDPALFAREGRVDCFSLYLSLREVWDERVEAALEEMMEGDAVWS